jgi:outer membrane beta-barrel protein
MKRTAVSLFVWCAISAWAAAGYAKRGGGGARQQPAPAAEAPAAQSNDDKAAADAPAAEKPAADSAAAAGDDKDATPSESLDDDPTKGTKVDEGDTAKPVKANSTASWQDIVVVPRKPFLKASRFEFAPFTGLSINDNLIRHYAFGGDINFFLSDVFWIGVEGQYFIKAFTDREDLIGLQYNRIPTLNRYLYGASFNLGYVPVYGKFALVNKAIVPWEIYASAGIGWTRSEVIPRNPGDLGWTNDLLTGNVAVGSRFFLFDWLTINFAFKDYIMADKFEPTNRMPGADLAAVKAAADSKLVQNVMFYAGVGMYLPAKFQYKSPR